MATKRIPRAQKKHKPITVYGRRKFLELVADGMTLTDAAQMSGHGRSTFYDLLRSDPKFSEEYQAARELGTDALEREAWRRAVEGWDEPVFGKVAPGIDGQLTGPDGKPLFIRRYSDRLMEVQLKGRRSQYKDNPRLELNQNTVHINMEDKSASLDEVFRVLKSAGGDLGEVVEGEAVDVSDGGAQPALPAAEGVLAEPGDVQPEAGRVPARKRT